MALRSCLVCREKVDSSELLRLVVSPSGEVWPDLKGNLPGRGAWIHFGSSCWDSLNDRHLSRAFKAKHSVGELRSLTKSALTRAALNGLSLAAAAGAMVGGYEKLKIAMVEENLLWLVLASDASQRTLSNLGVSTTTIPTWTAPLDRHELGGRIGKGSRAAIGILGSRASRHLCTQLRRLSELG